MLHATIRYVTFVIVCVLLTVLKLADEPELNPTRLLAIDGNNSAKRVMSVGTKDTASFESNYFLPREEVDRFKDEMKRRTQARESKPSDEEVSSMQYSTHAVTELTAPQVSDAESISEDEDAPWLTDSQSPGDTCDGQEKPTPCTKR